MKWKNRNETKLTKATVNYIAQTSRFPALLLIYLFSRLWQRLSFFSRASNWSLVPCFLRFAPNIYFLYDKGPMTGYCLLYFLDWLMPTLFTYDIIDHSHRCIRHTLITWLTRYDPYSNSVFFAFSWLSQVAMNVDWQKVMVKIINKWNIRFMTFSKNKLDIKTSLSLKPEWPTFSFSVK